MTLQKAILRNCLQQRVAEVMFHTINDDKLVDRFYFSEQPPFQILLKTHSGYRILRFRFLQKLDRIVRHFCIKKYMYMVLQHYQLKNVTIDITQIYL